MMKVGLLGGTFDPPHNGHLMIAQEVLTCLQLEEIWFMPTHIPPHKKKVQTTAHDRMEMVRRAIFDNDQFKLQTIEYERQGPSYTYDTIILLNELYPRLEFYFIIGADMVEYLPKWYRIDELIQRVHFVGVKRPGFKLSSKYNILEVEVPQFDISSSELRKRFRNRQNTRYFLPDRVRQYIEEKRLYGEK